MIGYVETKNTLKLIVQGKTFHVKKTSASYTQVLLALRNEDEDLLLELLDKRQQVIDFSEAQIEFRGNALYFRDYKVPTLLTNKIVSMYDQGFPFKPFVRFYERLLNTPSNNVLNQLFDYLESGKWPLLSDGRVMAYKVVLNNSYKGREYSDKEVNAIQNKQYPVKVTYENTSETFKEVLKARDYIDCHSRSVPQGVGDIISVSRNSVDDDPEVPCSYGLHVGTFTYTSNYGSVFGGSDVILNVAVCPSDWVSVPRDYDCNKSRVCKYEIISVSNEREELNDAVFGGIDNRFEEDEDYDDEYEDEEDDD